MKNCYSSEKIVLFTLPKINFHFLMLNSSSSGLVSLHNIYGHQIFYFLFILQYFLIFCLMLCSSVYSQYLLEGKYHQRGESGVLYPACARSPGPILKFPGILKTGFKIQPLLKLKHIYF